MSLPSGDPRLPLYARMRDALASRIASLEWRAGEAIPTEQDLARSYGVSIQTLRKAVEQLVREGLLDRRQGSGTFVRRPSFDGSLFRWFNFEDGLAGGGRTVPESRLLDRRVVAAPEMVASRLGLAVGDEVIQILRLRLWAGAPVITEDLYLPYPRYRRIIAMPADEIGPLLYPVYEREFGDVVAAVEDELSLGTADELRARLLLIPLGTPIVLVDRSSLSADGAPIEWRRAHGRGDRFRYRVRLS